MEIREQVTNKVVSTCHKIIILCFSLFRFEPNTFCLFARSQQAFLAASIQNTVHSITNLFAAETLKNSVKKKNLIGIMQKIFVFGKLQYIS
jgi:hypothetical protein